MAAFPETVKNVMGFALHEAQLGCRSAAAKNLSEIFKGQGVIEIVEDFSGDAYRVMYTIRLVGAVYALHAFKKKSKKGKAIPPGDIKVIRTRLQEARDHHDRHYTRNGLPLSVPKQRVRRP